MYYLKTSVIDPKKNIKTIGLGKRIIRHQKDHLNKQYTSREQGKKQ